MSAVSTRSKVLSTSDLTGRNLGIALRVLHEAAQLRRVDLARQLGVSRSAAGRLLDGLERLGLVDIAPATAERIVGRPSPEVRVGTIGPVLVHLDMHADDAGIELHAIVVGLGGHVHGAPGRIRLDSADLAALPRLLDGIESALPAACELRAVSTVGAPASPLTPILQSWVAARAPRVTVVENARVALTAWGEHVRGRGRRDSSTLVIAAAAPHAYHLALREPAAFLDGVLTDFDIDRDTGRAGSTGSTGDEQHTRPPDSQPLHRLDELIRLVRPGRILIDVSDSSARPPAALARYPHIGAGSAGARLRALGAAELFFEPWFADPLGAQLGGAPPTATS